MFKNKTLNIIVSILIALCLWIYVVIEVNPQTTKKFVKVPISMLNEDSLDARGLALLDGENLTVDILVEGNKAALASVKIADFKATADLFGREKGKNHIPIVVRGPKNVKVTQVSPENIVVNIEEKVTVTKPLEVDISGDLPPGYTLESAITNPEEVTISGAKTLINKVTNVVAIIPNEKVTGETINITSNLIAKGRDGNRIGNISFSTDTARVSGKFVISPKEASKITTKEFQFTNSDIRFTNLGKDLEASTSQKKFKLTVKGDEKTVSSLTSKDFALYINCQDINVGENTLKVEVSYDISVGFLTLDPSNVKVKIKEV